MSEAPETPVLFCVFNRPALTARVFESIRRQRPSVLFISCDGPRSLNHADQENVDRVRGLVKQVDWDCDVRMRFLDSNLGCKQAMSSAISWAFEQEDRLIILEDDCLADPSFFGYCDQLLHKYQDESQVMMISGNNFQESRHSDDSYYFSRWAHIWGWATWKRAWKKFDINVTSWPRLKQSRQLQQVFTDPFEYAHWSKTLDAQHAGQIDTWDFPWAYALWANGGLSILPHENLVTNIGFGPDATHTLDPESRLADIPAGSIGTLQHPKDVVVNEIADKFTWENVFLPGILAASVQPSVRRKTKGLLHRIAQKLKVA